MTSNAQDFERFRRHALLKEVPQEDPALRHLFEASESLFLETGERAEVAPWQVVLVHDGRWLGQDGQGRFRRIGRAGQWDMLGLWEDQGPTLEREENASPRWRLQALSPTRCTLVPFRPLETLLQAHVQSTRAYLRHARRHMRDQEVTIARLASTYDDFFLGGCAGLVPGPYHCRDVQVTCYVLEGGLREMDDGEDHGLPAGCRPLPGPAGNRALLAFFYFPAITSAHTDARPAGGGPAPSFAYEEVAFFVPCLAPRGRIGVFCPEIYPESSLAIALGRELYGLPKRFAVNFQHRNTHPFFQALVLDGHLAVEATARRPPHDPGLPRLEDLLPRFVSHFLPDGCADAAWLRLLGRTAQRIWVAEEPGGGTERLHGALAALLPRLGVFVRHQVPATGPTRHRVLACDRLVHVPFEITRISRAHELAEPRLTYHQADRLPLEGRCLAAYELTLDMTLTGSHVLRRYDRLWRLRRRALLVGERLTDGYRRPETESGPAPSS